MKSASYTQVLGLLLVASSSSFSSSLALEPRRPLTKSNEITRRDLGWSAFTFASATTLSLHSPPVWADQEGGLLSTTNVADILHVVPTFTIVDAKGVPFMVVGEDAKVTGYFFVTYEEANRLLQLAKTSADKSIKNAKKEGQEDIGENPWNKARISTVPLDFATTLVSKSIYTKSHFQIAPAEQDIEDALAITGKKDLQEGKVPLFYIEDFKVDSGSGKQQSPVYFRKSELVEDYKKQNKANELPPILVTELFAVLLEMVKPGGTDEDLKNLVLMTPKGSVQKAKQCEKAGGKEPPFVLGQRNLVL